MDYTTIQEEREKEAIEGGIKRYREALARDPASASATMRVLGPLMEKAGSDIEGWIKAAMAGKGTKGKDAAKLAGEFEPSTLAYMTLKVILEQTREGPVKLTRVVFRLAELALAQVRLDAVKRTDRALYRRLQRQLRRNRDSYAIITARRSQQWAKGQAQTIRWTLTERYTFGRTLIELVSQSTGFAEVVNWIVGKKAQQARLKLTEKAAEALRAAHAAAEILSPIDGPMVCRPRPWVGLMRGNGGFLTPGMARVGMLAPAGALREINNNVSEQVLRAMNALQDTRWAINVPVLAVAEALWKRDQGEAGAPQKENIPLPSATGIERETDAFRSVMKARAAIHDKNNRKLSKAVAWQMALSTARSVAGFPAIHFVHTMDFRGRIYPNSSYLSPQGNDLQRGLLTFADKVRLGDNGAYWLAVHGANSYGIDKVSFDERAQWVSENEEKIREAATNPSSDAFWKEADAPWQFLAFCYEWTYLLWWVAMGNDMADFESGLPVSFDGTCNGLQHFAAMLRDEKAAKLVNLVPSEAPQDVYRAVADEAVACLTQSADEKATLWARVLASPTGRSVVKRNTMTQPYAVSDYGMADQLVDDLPGIIEGTEWDEKIDLTDDKVLLDHARFLAAVHREAINTQIASANEVMSYVRSVAKLLAEGKQPMRWVTPIGLPVVQHYTTRREHRMGGMTILGKKVNPVFKVSTPVLSAREQDTGAAPNFVHSMDASHLMATVNLCLDDGVSAFGMVHDSYGTHAGSADTMRRALADAFVWQYGEHDVLADLAHAAALALPSDAEVPAVPSYGLLNLDDVRKADYFFA